VVPEPRALQEWAKREGLSGDLAELCKSDKARKKVLESLTKTGREQKLKGFEIIKAVHLEPKEWTTDEDLITTSLKLKRNKLQKKYQAEIDEMYKQLKAQGGGN
jgi:long-chain acyl-CoA synthetase